MKLVAELMAKQELIQVGAQEEHSLFKILFIEDGQGWLQIGQRNIQASSGDLFLIAPNERYDLAGLDNVVRWIVAFGSDALVPGRVIRIYYSFYLPNFDGSRL